ncbi:MAG TPA: hypothetical protein VFI11_01090 [Anaerolineales bacterium]|nr:hypothetical protein [Anaerolineales bacterium]
MDQLVELQPGLGRLMPEVSRRYWILYYAAKGGNWPLAGHQLRQMRHLFRMGSTTRPKMAKHLDAFQQGTLDGLEAAIQARDWPEFDRQFQAGIQSANRFHVTTNHPEIRWKLPANPPEDMDLTEGDPTPSA